MLHAAIVLAVFTAPVRNQFRTAEFVAPVEFHPEHYDIVYVPSHALPQMSDAGGASAGASGTVGGAALQMPEQTIRIARGKLVIPHVVDVPKLALPHIDAPANLLVSSAPAPSIPVNAIQHERIMTVQAFASTSVVPPTPQIVRERISTEPALPVSPVPPPVSTPSRDTLIGSRLELPTPVAPPKQDEAATLAAIKAGVPPPDVKVVDIGSIAPPRPKDTAVVVSSQPGTSIGKTNSQSPGAIAMSPAGAGKPGIGEGVGTGAANGASTGGTTKGGGTGTSTVGTASGDGSASAGISPGVGPGGSGAGVIAGAIPGVTISGNMVMVPSFGPSPKPGNSTARMPEDQRNVRPVTIVSTANSGGAVSARGLLAGQRVYTIYIDTAAGLAFLQFSEHASGAAQHDLTAPEPILSAVPSGLKAARVLLAGIMDRNGALKNLRVLEAASPEIGANLLQIVQHWHFRPALLGDDPVEIDALLGLNVDTR
jgi:hypothetical protein